MPASREFIEFEDAVDSAVERLTQGKSIRSAVTLLNFGSYVRSHNRGFGAAPDESSRGLGVERLGYLLPLITRANPQFNGTSAYDAICGWGPDNEQHLNALLNLWAYAEFCELAPFVHREKLSARMDAGRLILDHPSDAFRDVETKDILISKAFQPFTVHAPEFASSWFDAQVQNLPVVDLVGWIEVLQSLASWFREHTYEISPLSDAAMLAAIGEPLAAYKRFSAACLALGQAHMSMADAISRRANRDHAYGHNPSATVELLEWCSPCLNKKYIWDLLAWLAGITPEVVDKFMTVYSTSGGAAERRGEGFFPPFVQADPACIFSPITIRHMMSSRNILYTLAKHDPRRLEDSVSEHLEAQLVAHAVEKLKVLEGLEVRENIRWEGGQIDLMVYRSSENVALVIEAKGAVAPEGARMVERVESRIQEGIQQLTRFELLPSVERDRIVSRALGTDRSNVRVVKGILAWGGFGSEPVWLQLNDIAPLNVSLLSELVSRDRSRSLSTIVADTHSLIDELIRECSPNWGRVERRVCGHVFEQPILRFDERALAKYRIAPHA